MAINPMAIAIKFSAFMGEKIPKIPTKIARPPNQ